MISKKYPNYHIIIGDDIRWAFQEVLPNNNINSKGGIGMLEDFPNFLSVNVKIELVQTVQFLD